MLQKFATILMTLFLALIPTPKGLQPKGWCFLSIFIGGSVGLIMEPAPAALVGLSGVSLVAVMACWAMPRRAATGRCPALPAA